jgi:hypothetical protein
MALGYGPAVKGRVFRPDPYRQRTSGGRKVLMPEAILSKGNFTPQLPLLRPRARHSRSSGTRVCRHRTSAHLVRQVAAPNVKGKGFDQVIGKPLAPKLLSTHRAARIPPLENIDSQRCLAFPHAPLCHNIRLTFTLTFWLWPPCAVWNNQAPEFLRLHGKLLSGVGTAGGQL